VDVDNYQDLIDKYHLERLILTSSVTGEGVDETFQSMADQLPTEPEFFRSV